MTAAYKDITVPDQATSASKRTLKRMETAASLSKALHAIGCGVRSWGYSRDLYRHRLSGRHPVQLLASPDDPAPGNATLGSSILGGDLLFASESQSIDARFWINLIDKHPAFFEYGHRFHWLQDLAQVGDQKQAREVAEFLVRLWLEDFGDQWQHRIWDPENLGRRLINWLSHAPLILSSMDLVYRSKVLNSMARQARHLMRTFSDAPSGLGQLYATGALALAGLVLPGGSAWYQKGLKSLEMSVDLFVLPDGGITSRNTSDVIKAMQLLVLIRNAHRDIGKEQPIWIQPALDRMAPFVRAMRHANGQFAHFSGASADGGHGTEAILAASEATGKALESAPHTGYQRLAAANATVIIDAGPPPVDSLSKNAHASTGAFEFSDGLEQIIVNMGKGATYGPIPELADMCRTTAAHSTIVIADRNSTKIDDKGHMGVGVNAVSFERTVNDALLGVTLEHDGYESRFGVKHERQLMLRQDGLKLSGIDTLDGKDRGRLNGAEILIRFHLHPSVGAAASPDGRVTLETSNGKLWIFDAVGGLARIEDSLYLARPDEPRASKQIVVRIHPADGAASTCKWYFERINIS
jgi:uncharacterized heparinase superfamily protein